MNKLINFGPHLIKHSGMCLTPTGIKHTSVANSLGCFMNQGLCQQNWANFCSELSALKLRERSIVAYVS